MTIAFILGYWALWSLFFMLVQRPVFIWYNRQSAREPIAARTVGAIYAHGWRTDIIVGAYLTAIPILAAVVQMFVRTDFITPLLTVYNAVLCLVIALMTVGDTLLYEFWHYKIDASVLPYLRSPKGATASVSTLYLLCGAGAVILLWALSFVWIQWWVSAWSGAWKDITTSGSGIWSVMAKIGMALLMMGLCFISIRGAGRRPNNPSLSFFSHNLFYNHCALNPVYNFIYSLSVHDKIEGAFHAFDDETACSEFRKMMPETLAPVGASDLLTCTRPNILFIVWESLSARFVESLGGQPGVTPNFDRLSREGIFFRRMDCGSFRTDRGLVCLLSGYPAQPTTSVIRMTKKLPNLPALPRRMKEEGYVTTVIHGGDLKMFHFLDYFLSVGHDTAVDIRDFAADLPRGKWGVHDHVTFDYVYDDIMKRTERGERWFTTFMTLSSHETWEVPYSRIKGDEIANSFAYVDDCLGRFIDRLKQTPAWKDMLVVVVGDHGCQTGKPIPLNEYAHIPALLLGGAVKAPRVVDTLTAQTDLAATILAAMGMPSDEFIFSRDVLAPSYTYPFTFHTFVNGFMLRDETGYTVYDNVAQRATDQPDPERERKGKVMLQYLYADLAKR